MPKYDLETIANLQNETSVVATINANNVLIEEALDAVLYREGTGSESDNAMDSDLDMNANRILNLPEPVADQEPARKVDLEDWLADAEAAATAAETAQTAAEAAQTAAETAETNAETAEAAAEATLTAIEAFDNTPTIGNLLDVTITNPQDNEGIIYDSGTEEWVNGNPSATVTTLNDVGDVEITSAQDGDVLSWDSGAGDWVNSALASAGWAVVGTWTHSVNVTNVEFTDLEDYSEIIVIFRGITCSGAAQRMVQFSTDNGSSWDTTTSNYVILSAAGVESNPSVAGIFPHSTGSTAARSGVIHIRQFNKATLKPVLNTQQGRAEIIVNTTAFDALRLITHNGDNMTAGSAVVLGRLG